MAKMGEQKTHTITLKNGEEKTFILQHIGVRETLRLMSRAGADDSKMIDELITHVILHEDGSRVTWDFFEELDGGLAIVGELSREATKFLGGKE